MSHDGRYLYASTDIKRPNKTSGLFVVDLINPPIIPSEAEPKPLPGANIINTDQFKAFFASNATLPVALPDANPPKLATSSIGGVNVLELRLSDESEPNVAIFWREEKEPTLINSPPALGGAVRSLLHPSGQVPRPAHRFPRHRSRYRKSGRSGSQEQPGD